MRENNWFHIYLFPLERENVFYLDEFMAIYQLFRVREVSSMRNSPRAHLGELLLEPTDLIWNNDFILYFIVWKFLQFDWSIPRGVEIRTHPIRMWVWDLFTSSGGELEIRSINKSRTCLPNRWVRILLTLELTNQIAGRSKK